MERVFEALGDPVRRRLLELLADGEQAVGSLVARIQPVAAISQPAISQHLKVLLAANLVAVREQGTRRHYAIKGEGVAAAHAWLETLVDPLAQFESPLDALATEVARGKRTRRKPSSASDVA